MERATLETIYKRKLENKSFEFYFSVPNKGPKGWFVPDGNIGILTIKNGQVIDEQIVVNGFSTLQIMLTTKLNAASQVPDQISKRYFMLGKGKEFQLGTTLMNLQIAPLDLHDWDKNGQLKKQTLYQLYLPHNGEPLWLQI